VPENPPSHHTHAPADRPAAPPVAPLAEPPVARHAGPVKRPAHWPIVVLRCLSVLVLLQVLLQAVLAGGFITGRVAFLGLHSANGVFLVLTSLALLLATIPLVRPGRGPWWPIGFGVVLWLLIGVQVGIGFARLVGLHIPIGMSIMGLISGFTCWTFAYRTAR
jgi:hypothetical protein